jgi:hypothetical protein
MGLDRAEGRHRKDVWEAADRLCTVGVDQYMRRHVQAEPLYRHSTTGGQCDLDSVYRKGKALYVVAEKWKKTMTKSCVVPGETLSDGSPVYAIEGTDTYLRLALEWMCLGNSEQKKIAAQIVHAWREGNVIYLQVSPKTRADGTAYFSVRQFKVNRNSGLSQI